MSNENILLLNKRFYQMNIYLIVFFLGMIVGELL